MLGLLVKNGATVVDKLVFAGDESIVSDYVQVYQAKHPTLTIEIHSDKDADWKSAFDSIALIQPKTQTQLDWLTARASGGLAAIVFLAKQLGLE